MKKSLIITIFTLLMISTVNAQCRKNFYCVTLDTIQHINWPQYQTIEQAQRSNTLEYQYRWTTRVIWEYDLINKTATQKGGASTKVYKIYTVRDYDGSLTLTIGDDIRICRTVQIKNKPNETTLFTSKNVESVDGKTNGYFSRNVEIVSH